MAGVDMPPQLPTVVTAGDGVTRSRWASEAGRDLTGYHDQEWGTPTRDEGALFEALVLTYFENCRFSRAVSYRASLTCGDGGRLTLCHTDFVSSSCHFFSRPVTAASNELPHSSRAAKLRRPRYVT